MTALGLEDDGAVEREVRLARVETLRASLAAAREVPGDEMSGLLHRRYELLLRRAEADLAGAAGGPARPGGPALDAGAEVVRTAAAAARRRLVALRSDGTIGDAAFQRVEQELDLEELNFQPLAGAAAS
jgi:CPA1 family monovalent cation:H+ antiporter